MHDMHSNIKAAALIAPAVHSATVTPTGEIDTQGFGSLEFVIATGAIVGDGDFTAAVQESDLDSPETWTAVKPEYLLGSLPASLEANTVYRIGYVGSERYVRVVLTKNGGTSIAASVVAVQGDPALAPVA